jgi:hypothetical protein
LRPHRDAPRVGPGELVNGHPHELRA